MNKLTLYFPYDFPVKDLAGQSRELDSDAHDIGYHWLIGRKPDCQIVVNHERVSGHHCAIAYSHLLKIWKLVDLGSSNGTWIKTKRLEASDEQPIEPGDRFYLAASMLTICVVENEGDTFQQEEVTVIQEAPPKQPEVEHRSRTFADVLYAAFGWIASATSPLGVLWRFLAVSAATALTIILIAAVA